LIEIDKSNDIKNGISIYHKDNGDTVDGPIFTGGPDQPFGLDFPTNTYYAQVTPTGILNWRKFGTSVNDWIVTENTFRASERTEDVYIPAEEILLMPCIQYSGNLIIDGEAYFI